MPFKPNEYYSEPLLWGILFLWAKSLKHHFSDSVLDIFPTSIYYIFIVKIVGLPNSDSKGEQ